MKKKGNRQHRRIAYNGKVDLVFTNRELTGCTTKNLCLSGVWISGCDGCEEGEQCDIYFYDAGLARSRAMTIKGQVSRIDEEGIAVALIFTDMNMRTYTNLQTMIENYSDESFEDADEFLDELNSK